MDPFYSRRGCPFCDKPSSLVAGRVRYHDTFAANPALPNIEGSLLECLECGIGYTSHGCPLSVFPVLYRQALRDWSRLDRSLVQRMRVALMTWILAGEYRPFSLSRLLNRLSCFIFQIPPLSRRPRGLRVLDVGCGFGELMAIFRSLGNGVVGTEVIPELVAAMQARGLECHLGEVEKLDLPCASFDVAVLRAVFYRTAEPALTLRACRRLLRPGGELTLVDPCPRHDGVDWFLRRQFPQGHFYILNPDRYLAMLGDRFGLRCTRRRQIYGRPDSLLRPLRWFGIEPALELVHGNLLGRKPYVMAYNLS